MKSFLTLTLLIAALPLAAANEKPNIICIFTDDHGYADIASQRILDDLKTPNIDFLAKGGARMTSGYSSAPQCVPSRAGLMSGRYQNRFGVESNGFSLDGFNQQQTIGKRLQKAGYATGMSGKWHLGPAAEVGKHGFDDVYYKNSNRPGWSNYDLDGNDKPGGPEKSKLYHLDANSQAVCTFIDRHHDEPFFFYCAYRAPHVPLDAPQNYLDRFPGKMPERRRQALAMISAMDDGIGKILTKLREHNLVENTLIFFIGDNGAPLKIHKLDAPGGGPGWDGSLNTPMNGEKGMLSEGGMRVPFVAYWKGTIPAGLVYDHPVISLDVAATSVALAGLPHDPNLDGKNLIPYLTGENKAAPHDALYWRWITQSAIREGKYKYLKGGDREYLYDLDADKEEQHNLIQSYPQVAARLKARLTDWASELDPPGIDLKSASTAWVNYFDFYLDGKPAPPIRSKFVPKSGVSAVPANITVQRDAVQNWLTRNGVAKLSNGSLLVTPDSGKRARSAFMSHAKLKVMGPAKVSVNIQNNTDGKIGVAWRLEGEKDFTQEARTSVPLKGSNDFQTVEIPVGAKGRIIHLRLMLPEGASRVRDITLDGKTTRLWDFGK